MTDSEIHHEYTLLQLAADAADNACFDACHDPGYRGARLASARAARKQAERAAEKFYAANKSAIADHLESFNVN